MNKKIIFGIVTALVIGLFVVAMYSADVVFGEEKTEAAAEEDMALETAIQRDSSENTEAVLQTETTTGSSQEIQEIEEAAVAITRDSIVTRDGSGSETLTPLTQAQEPQDLEALFLSRLPEELRNQVLEMKRTMDPVQALMMRARELRNQ